MCIDVIISAGADKQTFSQKPFQENSQLDNQFYALTTKIDEHNRALGDVSVAVPWEGKIYL